MLYHAHSGLRYLVLAAGLGALVALAYAVRSGRPVRAANGLATAFTGLLDLQILLGIALVVGGIFYGALTGHLLLMLVAAAAAHVSSVRAKRAADVAAGYRIRLIGIVAALLAIVLAILAIGRSVVGTAPPTIIN